MWGQSRGKALTNTSTLNFSAFKVLNGPIALLDGVVLDKPIRRLERDLS